MVRAVAIVAALVWLSAEAQAGPLPNPILTPGLADNRATVAVVCGTKWGKTRRHVTAATRRIVFASYGMSGNKDARCQPKGCELDHLISRELGGSDDRRNLWPQPNFGPWNAKIKDRLENRLRREVCHDGLPLPEAQRMIATDWVTAYRQFFGEAE